MTRVPPMACIAHRVPECPACKASTDSQRPREPVAWRFKERINDEFDSDWILTKYEPADGVRIIAKEPLYTAAGAAPSQAPSMAEVITAALDALEDNDGQAAIVILKTAQRTAGVGGLDHETFRAEKSKQ